MLKDTVNGTLRGQKLFRKLPVCPLKVPRCPLKVPKKLFSKSLFCPLKVPSGIPFDNGDQKKFPRNIRPLKLLHFKLVILAIFANDLVTTQ